MNKPAQSEIIRGRFVVQSLQHDGGGDTPSRVETRFQLQLEPHERFTRDNKNTLTLIQ